MSEPTLTDIAVTLAKIEAALEQIASDKVAHARERHDLRQRQRDLDSDMQALDLRLVRLEEHDLPPRVKGLEAFRWKMVGAGVALSTMSGVISGAIVAVVAALL